MNTNYKKTMYACFIGYIVQAIVNNFVPLLFVTFQNSYKISLSQVTALITVNFIIQLLTDMLSAGFIDKIGYRVSAITAHIFAATGLILLTILPEILPDSFLGIIISVIVYAVGGGLLEVLVSPIIEACPTKNKEKAMSLLHSFYCWGHMGVILISTAFFYFFDVTNWRILTLIWAVIPIANIFLFIQAPIYALSDDGNKGMSLKELFSKKVFWILMLMMMSAGASEQAVSQWASAFAEKALGISKTTGDLAGPMAFAMLMGTARLIYGKYGDKLNLERVMKYSCYLCIVSYVCISLIPVPLIDLLGCAVCGFSVGILWPGTFSKSASALRGGGTVLFAMLALAGDFGCSAGPSLAGYISSGFGGNLRAGILAAAVFPLILLISLFALSRKV